MRTAAAAAVGMREGLVGGGVRGWVEWEEWGLAVSGDGGLDDTVGAVGGERKRKSSSAVSLSLSLSLFSGAKAARRSSWTARLLTLAPFSG